MDADGSGEVPNAILMDNAVVVAVTTPVVSAENNAVAGNGGVGLSQMAATINR